MSETTVTPARRMRPPKIDRTQNAAGARSQISKAIVALKVGHMFYVKDPARADAATSAVFYWGRKLGRTYTTRHTEEGFGIWRVK